MSATALISGRLWKVPERKLSKAGAQYVVATIREGAGDRVTWWKILCFSESGCDELLRLDDGDGVAASGAFEVDTYEKNGEVRLNYTLVAERVISARRQKRESKAAAMGASGLPTPDGAAPLDDEIPF
ncbi:MAG: single-stranded DNA-binding protein [Bradyrhizobium sp.]|nr:MAG: single-stranded DNA-binding protein [Bradyrhizobium sp.]